MGDDPELTEVLEFGAEQAADEQDEFDGDLPEHGDSMLLLAATDVMEAAMRLNIAEGINVDEDEQEQFEAHQDGLQDAMADSIVDVLLALGSIVYEYDVDTDEVAETFEDRVEFMAAYEQYEDAVADAESHEEVMTAIDEIEDEVLATLGMDNLDGFNDGIDEYSDYDHTESGRGFQ